MISTIKYYLRIGLVSPGTTQGSTWARYDESHLRRVRLVRALTGVAGLSLEEVRRIVESIDASGSDHQARGAAQWPLSPALAIEPSGGLPRTEIQVACLRVHVSTGNDVGFPAGSSDERELLLSWLGYLRGAVLRKLKGIDDEQARWRPDDALISLLGIVNHLTHVEWRWIDGGIRGQNTERSEAEFAPGPELTVADATVAYQRRGAATDTVIRSASSLAVPCSMQPGTDLRWVVLHLINETARHAGHADAVRELLDGTTGE